jgi:hypothetical protein
MERLLFQALDAHGVAVQPMRTHPSAGVALDA